MSSTANPCKGSRAGNLLSSNTIYIGNVLSGTQNKDCSKVCAQRGSRANPCAGSVEALELYYSSSYAGELVSFLYDAGKYDTDVTNPITFPSPVSTVGDVAGNTVLAGQRGYVYGGPSPVTTTQAKASLFAQSQSVANVTLINGCTVAAPVDEADTNVTLNNIFAYATPMRPALQVEGYVPKRLITINGWGVNLFSDYDQVAMTAAAKNGGAVRATFQNLRATGTSSNQEMLFNLISDVGSDLNVQFSSGEWISNGTHQVFASGTSTGTMFVGIKDIMSTHEGNGSSVIFNSAGDSSTITYITGNTMSAVNDVTSFVTSDKASHSIKMNSNELKSAVGQVVNILNSGTGRITVQCSDEDYATGSLASPSEKALVTLSVPVGGTSETSWMDSKFNAWSKINVPMFLHSTNAQSYSKLDLANSTFSQYGDGEGYSGTTGGTSQQDNRMINTQWTTQGGSVRSQTIGEGTLVGSVQNGNFWQQLSDTHKAAQINNIRGKYVSNNNGVRIKGRTVNGPTISTMVDGESANYSSIRQVCQLSNEALPAATSNTTSPPASESNDVVSIIATNGANVNHTIANAVLVAPYGACSTINASGKGTNFTQTLTNGSWTYCMGAMNLTTDGVAHIDSTAQTLIMKSKLEGPVFPAINCLGGQINAKFSALDAVGGIGGVLSLSDSTGTSALNVSQSSLVQKFSGPFANLTAPKPAIMITGGALVSVHDTQLQQVGNAVSMSSPVLEAKAFKDETEKILANATVSLQNCSIQAASNATTAACVTVAGAAAGDASSAIFSQVNVRTAAGQIFASVFNNGTVTGNGIAVEKNGEAIQTIFEGGPATSTTVGTNVLASNNQIVTGGTLIQLPNTYRAAP